jgi:type II secretory pathway pseudopilin PulG
MRARRGITLMELMVSIAIMILFVAVVGPTMSGMLMLKQRQAARELALVYAQLHDEAILRNRTFRVAFHLEEGFYEVEAGDRGALIFDDADARENFEDNLEEQKEDMTPEEWKAFEEKHAFKSIEAASTATRFELPAKTRFRSVYTPQYKDPLKPRTPEERENASKDEEKGPRIAYSYVFANGFAEYTVVQIVDESDEKEGFTVTVDPLSGKVDFYAELVDKKDAFDDLPDDPPRLSN